MHVVALPVKRESAFDFLSLTHQMAIAAFDADKALPYWPRDAAREARMDAALELAHECNECYTLALQGAFRNESL